MFQEIISKLPRRKYTCLTFFSNPLILRWTLTWGKKGQILTNSIVSEFVTENKTQADEQQNEQQNFLCKFDNCENLVINCLNGEFSGTFKFL